MQMSVYWNSQVSVCGAMVAKPAQSSDLFASHHCVCVQLKMLIVVYISCYIWLHFHSCVRPVFLGKERARHIASS